MKRFALKRITALVLALVMTLSLLPMTAWATDAVSEGDENNTSTVEQTTDPAQLYWYGYRNVWTNEEYIADRGTTHWFDVGADSAGTVLTWTSTPEITLSSNTLGTFELFEENEESRLKWDTTGALEGSGTVTLSLDSVDYVLNVRVNVLPMGLSAAGGDYSTAITLDQASYEWVLYAEQWNGDTQQNDYIRVTSDKFTIPNGGNLSFKDTDNDQVGDTLVFDAAGMEAADFPVDLYAVSIERGTYHRFQIRYNDGGSTPSNATQLYWLDGSVWGNSERVVDRGGSFTFSVATDADGTPITWVDTPTIEASTSGLGTFTPVNENGNVSIRWDATNCWDATGFITLTVDGVDYVLNVRTNVNRMGLEDQHNSFSTAITLDRSSYEWALYARQWDDSEKKNVYVPVTSDDFTIPTGSRLSWNKDADGNKIGDKLVFDATGLTADSFPIDVYVTATSGYQQNFYFQVNYDDGVFRHNGVEVYTYLDSDTGTLGYSESPVEDGLSLFSFYGHINYLFEKNVVNTLYLRPQSNVALMEICGGKYYDRENWEQGNIIDLTPPSEGTDYYTLTLYAGMTESGDVEIRLLDAAGNDCGSIQLIYEVPVTNPNAVQLWNYDGGWRLDGVKLDQGMTRQFIMSVGPQANKTILNPDNCTIDITGNIGTISWMDDGRMLLNTASATDEHGLIKVTMKDGDSDPSNNPTYYLAIQLIFQDLYVWNGNDYSPVIDIPFVGGEGSEVLSLECYFHDWRNNGELTKITPWSEETQEGFQLTASAYSDRICWDNNTGNVLFDTQGLTVGDLPITLTAVDSDGRLYSLELSADSINYYETAYSTITVRLSNTQARVLSLDPILNESGELIELKVNIKNKLLTEEEKDAWRKMAEEDMHLAVGYEFNAKDVVSGNLPDVFHFCQFDADAQTTVSDLHMQMWDIVDYEGEDKLFEDYNAYGHTRSNGNFCAWASANTGDLAILPSDSRDIYTWFFRYGTEGNYTYQEDGFVMKFEPEHPSLFNIEDAKYPAVDEKCLTHVPHEYLDTKLTITEYTEATQKFKYAEEGILTYAYQGEETTYDAVIADITDTAAKDELSIDQWGVFWYDLLKVNAPIAGYMAKTVECSYYTEDVYGANEVTLRYHWRGSATDLKFTITWFDPATGDEYVEQIIVRMSTLPGSIKWMDKIAVPMESDRVKFDEVPESSGAENSYSNGVLWTEYADGTRVGDTTGGVMVDVNTVLAAEVYFVAPDGATGFSTMYFGDGRDDATLNFNNGDMAESYGEGLADMESQSARPLTNWGTEENPVWGTESVPLEGLLKQTYGVDDEIEYYYSANRGTRGYFVKWFFKDGTSLCEYVQLDTSPYVCQWVSAAVDNITDVSTGVEKPAVVFDENINLVSKIHPQNKSGHFFFELEVVGLNDAANARLEQQGNTFVIILPYSFIGIDPDNWEEETAKLKTPMIKHFDEDFTLKENQGTIQGAFTARGIEFKVDDFSPFLLTWTEPGLYTNYQDGELSDLIEMTTIGQAVGYPINYEGDTATVYYWNPDLTGLSCTNKEGQGDVTVSAVEGETGLYSITLTGASGTVNVQMQEVRADGNTSGFPIIFSDGSEDESNGGEQDNYPPLFIYGKAQDGTYNYFNGTGFPVGGVQEFSLYIQVQNSTTSQWEYVPITEADGYILGCSDGILNGRITWSTAVGKENIAIVDTQGIALDSEKQVYLTATKGDTTYGLSLFLNPGGNDGGNGGGQNYPTYDPPLFMADAVGFFKEKININIDTKAVFYPHLPSQNGLVPLGTLTQADVSLEPVSEALAGQEQKVGIFSVKTDEDGKPYLEWDATNATANCTAVLSITVEGVAFKMFVHTNEGVDEMDMVPFDYDVASPHAPVAKITIDNKDYYLVPVMVDNENVIRGGNSSFNVDENSANTFAYTIGLATTQNGTDFTLVTDSAILAKLTDMSFTVTPVEQNENEEQFYEGGSYPLMLSVDGIKSWTTGGLVDPLLKYNPNAPVATMMFDKSSSGVWEVKVSAKVDGTVYSTAIYKWAVYKNDIFVDVPEDESDPIAMVNATLQALAENISANPDMDLNNTQIVINLPGGDLFGVIQVPGVVCTDPETEQGKIFPDVFIYGNRGTETVLHGGVHAENQITEVQLIRFVGAGKTETVWGKESHASLSGKNNYAIWGDALGGIMDCSFTGYDCAVKSTNGTRFGGVRNYFYDNNVALHLDVESGFGGNLAMREMVFAHNNVALKLDRFDSSIDLGIYTTYQNIFYDNGTDAALANSKRSFFMPSNVYDNANGLNRNFTGHVYGDPYYLLSETGRTALSTTNIGALPLGTYDKNWIQQTESGEFIKVFPANWKVPMIYANADDYVIPANELKKGNMTIDMVDNRNNGTNGVVATMKMKPATMRLMSLRSAVVEDVFNPLLEVSFSESGDKIFVTMNAVPSGVEAELTIPCVGWSDATVTDEGDYKVYSDFADGTVTFGAVGGTYIIYKKSVPTVTAPKANELTYTGEEQALVTAGTTSGGTMKYSLDGETYSTDIPTGTDAKTYEVWYKVEGDNYNSDVAAKSVTVTIAKAPLTITANANTITYGDAPANDGVSYAGFVNGETKAVLTGTLSYSYDYEQYGNVSDYAIVPAGLSSDNYAITFVDGTLTVEQKEIGIIWSNTELIYDGTYQRPDATATGVVNGDAITLTVDGATMNASDTAYTAEVTAIAGGKAENYKLPTDVTEKFTIAKQKVTKPVADTAEFIYSGAEQTYAVAANNAYTVNGNIRTDAGSQTVTVALKDKDNYEWSDETTADVTFTFTIAKATQVMPEVTGVNETVFAKNDGKITGVTSAMEYSVDGETYTAIADGKLENLAPDTYYVRYAEKDNFLASGAVTVAIAAGERITVTFDTNDGNEIEAIENLAYGDKVTEPTEPKKSGYTFAGWFSDEACTKAWDFDKDTVSADVTLYAKWNAIPVVYPPYVPETPTTPTTPTETKPTTPAQPTTHPAEVTVPVSGEENTINVEASVSGSTATIDKVDMNQLDGVIGDDVAVGTVTIDFSVLESTEVIDEVEIPAEVVKEIAAAVADPNNDAESLEIVLSDGASIEFDAAALAEKAAQAGGADITISIKHAVETNLSAAQQTAVGDRVAFDINVTSGGVHISDMGGKITIHAPYELRDGETADGIVVYYVDDEGNKEKCETSYDSAKKRVNWKTDHLSVYMIAHEVPADDTPAVDETPADDATQSDSANGIGLWIGVALVVLVIAIVVVVIAIKRKKA